MVSDSDSVITLRMWCVVSLKMEELKCEGP